MERIASFTVNHNTLVPGLYLSRRDGDIVTLDLRFKKPNTGDLLSNSELHSTEHLIATLLRNSADKEAVIYFGPMGCQTGFYFLFDSRRLSLAGAIALLQQVFRQAAEFSGPHARPRAPWNAAITSIWIWKLGKPCAAGMLTSSTDGPRSSSPIRNERPSPLRRRGTGAVLRRGCAFQLPDTKPAAVLPARHGQRI